MALEYTPKGKRDIGRPKTDEAINNIFKIEFSQDRARCPTSVYFHDDDYDDTFIRSMTLFIANMPIKLV
jgi:hypothetical protein